MNTFVIIFFFILQPALVIFFFVKWFKLRKLLKKQVQKFELIFNLNSQNGKIGFIGIDPVIVPFNVVSTFDGSIVKMYYNSYDEAVLGLNLIMQNNKKVGI